MRVGWFVLVVWLLALQAVAQTDGPSAEATSDAEFDDDFGASPSTSADLSGSAAQRLAAPTTRGSQAHDARDSSSLAHYATMQGLVGGVHIIDGTSATPGTFRIGLHGQTFKRNGFLVSGDEHRFMEGILALSFTPIEHLELAASVSSYANENRTEQPGVFQVVGDTHFFAKGYMNLLPALALSADLELAFLNGAGGLGLQGNATSVGLRFALSTDFRKRADPRPLILRTNLRYYFDNSANVVEDVERRRYASLSNPRPPNDETRHLASSVERFVFRINRLDTLTWTLGAEAPFALAQNWSVGPLLEWSMAVPTNRQGYTCLLRDADEDPDSCLENQGFLAWSTTLTAALRVIPNVRGLSALIGVDIATTGKNRFVRELAPNAPYALMLMIGYAYDVRPPAPNEKIVEVAHEPPPLGHLVGEVVDRETRVPVPQAIVHFDHQELTDLATDEAGKFVSYPFEPGRYRMTVSARDYESGSCEASLRQGGHDQELVCEIVAMPKRGTLRGSVKNQEGEVVAASIRLAGPVNMTFQTDPQGAFEQLALPPGRYSLAVDADGYLLKATAFTVSHGETTTLVMSLLPQPEVASAELRAKDIVIRKQVQFVTNSAEIREASHPLLAEVADVLLRNPQVTRVEVQGHTDDQGTSSVNMELSQQRAEAVRAWLITAGIAPERLTAIGYGRSRPRMPNITEKNRQTNRRVEFVILEQ
jgi:outer membrane protein OmpA-like peptidoglycan-associated protein